MSEFDQIEYQAAQWVAREDRGLTPEESEEFSSWLEATPHRVAYLRLKSFWAKSARLAALRGAAALSLRSVPGSYLWQALLWQALAAAAVILLLAGSVVAAFHFYQLNRSTQEVIYATQAGERPTIHLVDGTTIQLDANSKLHAVVSTGSRTVTLEKGEAYFEVVHDAGRPFTVIAGKHRISDLGTKFSVLRDGDDIRVVVTEGRVRVDDTSLLSPESPIFADRGNVVVANADETVLMATTAQQLLDDMGWREGRLTFNHQSLGEAAKDFNRYNSRKLVVTGAARDIAIGGSFRADNMDVFVKLISEPLGLIVKDQGDTVILSKK